MNIVAKLIKGGQVIDTYVFADVTPDDPIKPSNVAFAYFRDHHPDLTLPSNDVRIEFRRDAGKPTS